MKALLNNLKADLNNVFIMGNANNFQLAKVYVLLTVPALTAFFAIGSLS